MFPELFDKLPTDTNLALQLVAKKQKATCRLCQEDNLFHARSRAGNYYLVNSEGKEHFCNAHNKFRVI